MDAAQVEFSYAHRDHGWHHLSGEPANYVTDKTQKGDPFELIEAGAEAEPRRKPCLIRPSV